MKSTTSFREFRHTVQQNYPQEDVNAANDEWMKSAKATLGILETRPWDWSIYKVPNMLRRLKEDAYKPHFVSIGPFHVDKHELEAMTEHKWRYMLNFLRRAGPAPPDENSDKAPSINAFDMCGQAILELEQQARACYAEEINLNKHQLTEILLVDGCFMLELFIKHAEDQVEEDNQPHQELDPIINNSWTVPTLQHDLALLENQIPFVVLQKLFDTILNKEFRPSLNEFVLSFFRSALNLNDKAMTDIFESLPGQRKRKHLSDLLHSVFFKLPENSDSKKNRKGQGKIEWGFKRCATQLVKSGIRFQRGLDKDRLLDITFRDGVITIPQLYIQDITDSLFRNLIAFEQCSFGSSHQISSYARLMKSLIRSPQDTKLLRQKEIIINTVGGDDEVLTFFQSLCREVLLKDFYFSDLCEEVNKYNEAWLHWGRIKAAVTVRWNGYIRTLKKDYFSSPWTIISFFAALVLLGFTALQTFYTVRSYYPR